MKNLWLLTKVILGSTFNISKVFKKSNLKQNIIKILGVLGFVGLALLIMVSVYLYSYGIGTILATIGQVEVLAQLMMAIISAIIMMTTISRVKGTLFGFKDYDLVMSLPIESNIIVASRLLSLYIINLLTTFIIMVPGNIAYGVLNKPDPIFYIYSLIALVFIPVIPMIVGTILGTIIVYIASKMRRTNFVSLILNFVLVLGILLISTLTSSSEKALINSNVFIANKINETYPLARMYKEAVIDYNVISLILFIIISIVFLGLYVWIVGYKFKEINNGLISIATKNRGKKRKNNYIQSSRFFALYKNEFSRYFSSSVYVINTSFSMILLIILSVASLFIKPENLAQMLEIPEITDVLGSLLPVFISFCVVMVYTSACSISMEGKNLWIVKSIPVTTKEIFNSKIAVNLSLILPTVYISIILLTIGLSLEISQMLITMTMATAYAFFISVFGLLINLMFPKLNWQSEVVVVKQSLASLIAIFGGMAVALIPIGGQYLFRNASNPINVNLLTIILIITTNIIMYIVLIKKGSKLFIRL